VVVVVVMMTVMLITRSYGSADHDLDIWTLES